MNLLVMLPTSVTMPFNATLSTILSHSNTVELDSSNFVEQQSRIHESDHPFFHVSNKAK